MLTITNVRLRFLKTSAEEWKTVQISYTVSFNQLEVFAGVIFQTDSWIRSYDGTLDEDPNFYVRSERRVERNYIKANNEPASMTDSTIIRTRRFNEYPDIAGPDCITIPPVITIVNKND